MPISRLATFIAIAAWLSFTPTSGMAQDWPSGWAPSGTRLAADMRGDIFRADGYATHRVLVRTHLDVLAGCAVSSEPQPSVSCGAPQVVFLVRWLSPADLSLSNDPEPNVAVVPPGLVVEF